MSRHSNTAMSKTLKSAIWLMAILFAVGALAWGLRAPAVSVEVITVSPGPLATLIKDEGVTRVKDRYVISAPVSGYLRRIDAHVGDRVDQGSELTQIEPTPPSALDPRQQAQAQARVGAASATVEAAMATVLAAKARADQSEQAYARTQKLDQEGFAAQAVLEAAQTERISAAAALKTARFSADIAQYELAAAKALHQFWNQEILDTATDREVFPVASPVAGTVLKIHRQSAGVIQQGQSLLEVGDLSALEVSIDVLSFDAVSIKPGMAVQLERWGEAAIEGVVRSVEPVGFTKVSALGVEEQRVWIIVDLVSPREQWHRLGDGYRVEASFEVWSADSVLTVPNSSLFRHEDEWAVFVVNDGRAERRTVAIGHRSSFSTEVTSGLERGDVVIRFPDERLEVGARVEPRI